MVDTTNWKEFNLIGEDGLFEIEPCKCSNAGDLLEEGSDIEYIGARKDCNGFMRYVKSNDALTTTGNCIIFICDGQGSVGYANYIDHDFIGSTTLSVGYNKNLNENVGLFLVTVLDRERYRYSFGRKYRVNLERAKIKLPATDDGQPDWGYMDNFIEELKNVAKDDQKSLADSLNTCNTTPENEMDTSNWGEFKIGDLFDIYTGKDLIYSTLEPGRYDVVGHGKEGLGLVGKTQELDQSYPLFDNNKTISLADRGNFYAVARPKPFYVGTRVKALTYKFEADVYTLMFIATVINLEEFRVTYGRNATDKLPDMTIKLPIDEMGNPDNKYMSDFVTLLPYGDRI